MNNLSICILTYRRPNFLRNLLVSLTAQIWLPDKMEIIIIDTDPDQTGRKIAESFQDKTSIKIIYDALKRRRSTPEARNKSIQLSKYELIFILDDDQYFAPNTFLKLRDYWRKQPDYISGLRLKVDYQLPPESSWLKESELFKSIETSDHAIVSGEYLSTGGILLRRRIFQGWENPFDNYWEYLGGEDNAFFLEAEKRGEKFARCGSITIFESVPNERTKLSYILRSNFRKGLTYALLKNKNKKIIHKIKYFILTICYAILAIVLILLSLPFGKLKIIEKFALFVRQIGKLAAMVGLRYELYR